MRKVIRKYNMILKYKLFLDLLEIELLMRIFGHNKEDVAGRWINYISSSFIICISHPTVNNDQVKQNEIFI